jgi:hypothetical protein
MDFNRASIAVIPLKPDYDASLIQRVKHSQSRLLDDGVTTEKTTMEVPRLSITAGTYKLLVFLQEFKGASETLNWTTGPKLFEKFEILLQGFHQQTWSEIAQAVGTPTVLHFAEAITYGIQESGASP